MDEYLLTLVEAAYVKKINNSNTKVEEIFPYGWFNSTNLELKIKILNEAISTEKMIVDTASYKENIGKILRTR